MKAEFEARKKLNSQNLYAETAAAASGSELHTPYADLGASGGMGEMTDFTQDGTSSFRRKRIGETDDFDSNDPGTADAEAGANAEAEWRDFLAKPMPTVDLAIEGIWDLDDNQSYVDTDIHADPQADALSY